MTKQIRTMGALFAGVVLMSAALPGTAFAVDGQIAITQARAMAGGVTPGDAAGFPVTLSQPGSYVLSGVLTVPNADTDAIVIASDHVTLDLNGFAMLGPTDCSGGLDPCAGEGVGTGIRTDAVRFNITIRNGTIQGMGKDGIFLRGDSHLVEYVHSRSNGKNGIYISPSQDRGLSIVTHNTVQRNGATRVQLDTGAASYNVIDTNGSGLYLETGTVSYNIVTRNAFEGLALPFRASYFGNTMFQNGGSDVFLGTNLGQNLCGAVVCPGAQF
jgi:hypothetical protein